MLGGFSPAKYEPLQSFSLSQWQMLILHRRFLWDEAKRVQEIGIRRHGFPSPSADVLDALERAGIQKIWPSYSRENLPSMLGELTLKWCRSAESRWAELAGDPFAMIGDELIPWADTFQLLPAPGTAVDPSGIPPEVASKEADLADPDIGFFGAIGNVPLGRRHPIERDEAGRKLIYLEVDANQPNDVLIRGFARWLEFYRSIAGGGTQGISGTVRPETKGGVIALWLKWRLVPYIDLRIGAMLLGVTLPDALLRTVLFPDKPKLDTNAWDNFKDGLKGHLQGFLRDKGDDVLSAIL